MTVAAADVGIVIRQRTDPATDLQLLQDRAVLNLLGRRAALAQLQQLLLQGLQAGDPRLHVLRAPHTGWSTAQNLGRNAATDRRWHCC